MNSTRRYSVRKIVSRATCFVLRLELRDGPRRWIFPNAPWMRGRQKAVGVEVAETELADVLSGFSPFLKADFCVSGTCVAETAGRGKVSFHLEDSPLLRGSYVLLCPGWGRRTRRKMWLLIPASGKERG